MTLAMASHNTIIIIIISIIVIIIFAVICLLVDEEWVRQTHLFPEKKYFSLSTEGRLPGFLVNVHPSPSIVFLRIFYHPGFLLMGILSKCFIFSSLFFFSFFVDR